MITTFIDCIYYAKNWYEFSEDGRGMYWRGFAKCLSKDLGWEPKTKHEVAEALLAHIQNHKEDYRHGWGNSVDDVFRIYSEINRRMWLYNFSDIDDAVISWCRGVMQMLDNGYWDNTQKPNELFMKHE